MDVESRGTELDGDAEFVDKGLVFRGVVGSREVEADGVAEPTPV